MFDRLTGLGACDALIGFLAEISGRPVPARIKRQRSQLVDAMLDDHFFFGGKKIAIGAEPDLLWTIGTWLTEMGCTIDAAVTTTQSPVLDRLPVQTVLIGDLGDLERDAGNCDLLITHSHGRQAASVFTSRSFAWAYQHSIGWEPAISFRSATEEPAT